MAVTVELTYSEIILAAQIGVMRRVQDMKNNVANKYGARRDEMGWQLDIVGALGECAVAKCLNIYWSGNIGNLKAADVGDYEVRTRSHHHYDLILHPKDNDDALFILATGNKGQYIIHGYIKAKDGKRDKYWSDPAGGRPAFFVPQDALHDIEDLLNPEPPQPAEPETGDKSQLSFWQPAENQPNNYEMDF